MSTENVVTGDDALECGIQKKLIHAGTARAEFINGTKIYFHFQTVKSSEPSVIIDDSKKWVQKPMELIIGKKFKLEVWEACLKSMWLNEVARFSVVRKLVLNYASCSKQLREIYKVPHDGHKHGDKHDHHHVGGHCCGFTAIQQGLGYADLDKLFKNPEALEFIFEVVKIEQPNEYEKDLWALDDAERIEYIPKLKEEGNRFYAEKNYEIALDKYNTAITFLEQLMTKEKPREPEWNEINEKKLVILGNYIQCKLLLGEYYSVLEHAATVLEYQPDNIKVLYRRAKANRLAHNYDEARSDLKRLLEIDASSKDLYLKDIGLIDTQIKANELKEKQIFAGKLFQ